MKIDAFAHVFLPDFAQAIRKIHPNLDQEMPFLAIPALSDFSIQRAVLPADDRQIISMVNVNPEDYVDASQAAELVEAANAELSQTVQSNPDLFYSSVAMICANNIPATVKIIEQIASRRASGDTSIVGIQVFTRHLGRSIADPVFRPIFEASVTHHVPLWLHPVFDTRKPDNNTVFSWEYELSQAMMQIVQAGYFVDFPDLHILVHHAGAMVPYFYERIAHILGTDEASQFKQFYVDTALVGNAPALALAHSFYGKDHLLFGTDAPFAVAPAGATAEVIEAINQLPISTSDAQAIFYRNIEQFLAW